MTLREDVITNLVKNGIETFPLKDKRPERQGWQQIDEFVPEPKPFGVKLGGKSNVIVVDVDDISLKPHFEKFFEKTYSVKSGRGFHIYIRVNTLPEKIIHLKNSKNQGIDVITSGGFVVGESSDHYQRDESGNYSKSGMKYELLSKDREINFIDFESEIKPILSELSFELSKEPIKDRISNALKNGLSKGSRNNELFALACNLLKDNKGDISVVYDTITYINEKSTEPLSKQEMDQLFQSATETVQREIEENNSKHTKENETHEILVESPEELRAITLTKDGTRKILVYLPTKITKGNESVYGSKAYIISNGDDGKKIQDLELDDEIKQKFQCNLLSDFQILSRKWNYSDIQQYLASKDVLNLTDLFNNLQSLEKKYFEYEYDFDYYYQVCWITHTYFYNLFDYTPYNDYTGIKGTGKTKHLVFLSMLCYNGILSGDSSISVIFRTVQGTGATLCLDETEKLQGDKESKLDLETLLRNGFQYHGQASRSGDKSRNFNPEFFSVYSPKALGHIQGLDNVLEDRVITTNLFRTKNQSIANSYPDEKEDSKIYEVRIRLYQLWLDYGIQVKKLIPEAENILSDYVSGREMKLWIPIITMGLFFERAGVVGVIDKLLAKLKINSESRKISDLEDNLFFQVLTIIDKNQAQIPTQSEPLCDFINEHLQKDFKITDAPFSAKKINGVLVKLGFHNKRASEGIVWTNINEEQIKLSKEQLGLIEHTQATLSDNDFTNKNSSSVGNVGSVS